MSDTGWIVIRNWQKFQHYRDRRPPWIKHYIELLGDPNYLKLTLAQRGLLSGLWLMTAESRANIPRDTSWIGRRLNGRVLSRDLKALNDAGFIAFSASKPLAERYQDAPLSRARGETETEGFLEKERSRFASNEARPEEKRQTEENELEEQEQTADLSSELRALEASLADSFDLDEGSW